MPGSCLILCMLNLKSGENQLKFLTVLMVPAKFDIQFNHIGLRLALNRTGTGSGFGPVITILGPSVPAYIPVLSLQYLFHGSRKSTFSPTNPRHLCSSSIFLSPRIRGSWYGFLISKSG